MKKIFIKKKIEFKNMYPFYKVNNSIYFIIDKNLINFYDINISPFIKDISFNIYTLKKGENDKSISTFKRILKNMLFNNIEKQTTIISIGGGVCGDISGFVSSVFLRGIYLIHIPSTLLSQVDSSIGGKNGINYISKNIIGTFYKPKITYVSIYFLKRLNYLFYMYGYSEIIKISLINNKKLFYIIKNNLFLIKNRKYNILKKIVFNSIKSKLKITNSDLREKKDKRIKLNFGHTFAHSIEKYFNYKISHGEAVWMGMYFSLYYSLYLKCTKIKYVIKVLKLIKEFSINLKKIHRIKFKKIKKYIFLDKKIINRKVKFIIFNKIGKIIIKKIDYFNIKRIFFDFKKKMFII
ncbi:3-dehydroquinate synthase [Candidatus Vidania fulgoroideorum]